VAGLRLLRAGTGNIAENWGATVLFDPGQECAHDIDGAKVNE
jgi:hypothetical protein